MSAKKKPENQIKALEKLIQEARIIFSAQLLMEIDKTWSEAMRERVQRFLKGSE